MRMDRHYREGRLRRHGFGGVVLIVIGCALLADRMSLVDGQLVWHFWPVLVGLVGLGRLVGGNQPADAIWGALTMLFAFWLYACLEHLWGWSFRTTWPLVLIGFGLARVLEGLFWQRNRPGASLEQERKLP